MDQLNFYYLQRVLESELDLVQTNVGTALAKARQDLGIVGVHDAGVVAQNAPPDLNVLVSGPALGTDPDGERVSWPTQQTVDCSQDHLGASTSVVNLGNERWISVIAEYDQTLATPVTDGNGVTVYTRIYDSFSIYVTMGNEAAIGLALKPALPTDGILLADINLVFGGVQILTADIDNDRRQDLVHATGATIPTFYHGDLVDAVVALFGYVDGLSVGTGVTFTATGAWRDASTIASVNVSAAINEIVADLSAFAGAARTGVAAHATVGNYCDISDGALQTAINAICDAVAGHINGGAPAHPDTGITAVAIAGAPESFAGGFVRDVEVALYGHINDRTERATDETISGAWLFDNGASDSEDDQVKFRDATRFLTLLGGSQPPGTTDAVLAGKTLSVSKGWGHAFSDQNEANLGAVTLIDICVGFNAGARRILVLEETANIIYELDPTDMSTLGTSTTKLAAGLPAPGAQVAWLPTAMCCDGLYVYVMFIGDHGTPALRTHYLQAYQITDWSVKAGWPATGLALTGAGVYGALNPGVHTLTDRCCMIPELDKLVTANSWVPVMNSNSPAVSVIDTTNGTIDGSGAGDASMFGTPGDVFPCGGLASDGTNIYFTTYDTNVVPNPNVEIVSSLVLNPSAAAGSGINDFPHIVALEVCQELIFDHDTLWAIIQGENPVAFPQIGLHELDPGGTWEFHMNDNSGWPAAPAWFAPGVDPTGARFAAFDGLNLWVELEEQSTGGKVMSVGKIPVGSPIPADNVSMGMANIVETRQFVTRNVEGNLTHYNEFGRCCFDGDAVVAIVYCLAAAPELRGIVRKVPRAGSR